MDDARGNGPEGVPEVLQLQSGGIEALGLKVVEVRRSTEIIPGAYLTGKIERVTAYEKVPPPLLIKRGE